MPFRTIAVILAIAIVLGAFGAALALGNGNARKGKYLYRKNCRTCHAEGGKASDLSPISKLQAEWQKTFANPKAIKCNSEWAKLKEKDINDIYTYLYNHAKDSPSPAKCK